MYSSQCWQTQFWKYWSKPDIIDFLLVSPLISFMTCCTPLYLTLQSHLQCHSSVPFFIATNHKQTIPPLIILYFTFFCKWLTTGLPPCLCTSPGKLLDVDDQYYQGLYTSKSRGSISSEGQTSSTRQTSAERKQSVERRQSMERRQSSDRRRSKDRRQSTEQRQSVDRRQSTERRRASRERAVSEPDTPKPAKEKRCVIYTLLDKTIIAYTHTHMGLFHNGGVTLIRMHCKTKKQTYRVMTVYKQW